MPTPRSSETSGPELPDQLEEQCYQIWFDAEGDVRASSIETLCAAHREHAAAIRALVARLARSDALLGEARLAPIAPTRIGGYDVVAEIGRGGFGTVYRATQTQPVRRDVALKVLRPGRESQRAIARFALESEALARMQHPTIAKVFDAGTTPEGETFIAMELVDGVPIHEYCDRHRLDVEDRLRLIAAVCRGVSHAHQRGIIHRDLKPSNVLVAHEDDAPRPVVIDFGLAKALEGDLSDVTLTLDGGFVGTPAFTSPEQAAGRAVDTRADVHSLGLILFELLCGDLPHGRQRLESSSMAEALRIVREEDPPTLSHAWAAIDRPRQDRIASARRTSAHALGRELRGDLDGILMQALEREPDQRYGSADALADDLTRYLENLPVNARRPTFGYLIGKLARRHRVVVAMGALLLLAVIGGAAALVWGAVEVEAASSRARLAQGDAELRGYAASIGLAQIALRDGFAAEAAARLERTDPTRRGWEYAYLRRIADNSTRTLAYDGRPGAIWWKAEDELVVAEFGGGLRSIDPQSGAEIRVYTEATGGNHFMRPVGDGRTLVMTRLRGGQHTVDALDTETGEWRTLAAIDRRPAMLAVSSDGAQFAVYDDLAKTLQFGRIDGATPPTRWEQIGAAVTALAFWPDGESLVAGCRDGRFFHVDLMRNEIEPSIEVHARAPLSQVRSLCVDERLGVLIAGAQDSVGVWDLETGSLRFSLPTPGHVIRIATEVERGRCYISGGWGAGFARVFDVETGRLVHELRGNRLGLDAMALSPDGSRIVGGGFDHELRFWSTDPPRDVAVADMGIDVREVAMDVDAGRAAYCNMNGHVVVVDLETFDPIMDLKCEPWARVGERCALFDDEVYFVGWDGVLRAFAIPSGELLRERRVIEDGLRINGLEASPDGSSIAFSSYEVRRFGVLDRQSFETLWEHDVPEPEPEPFEVWFTPDGEELFCASYEGLLEIRDTRTYELRDSLRFELPAGESVRDVQWTHDGRRFVLSLYGGEVILFERQGLREIRRFAPHEIFAARSAISPDGSRIATGGADHLIRIHDFDSGALLLELRAHVNASNVCGWSPDGQRLYSYSHSWNLPGYLCSFDAARQGSSSN